MNESNFIWNKKQCIKAYDELMIKIAMSSYAEIDGQELMEDNKRLKILPQFQITPKAESNIRRIAWGHMLRKSVHHFNKGFYAITNKVAMVFLVISMIFATTLMVSAEFRGAIYKLVFTYEKQYTLIELDSRTALAFVGSEVYTWNHAFAPTMMPKGYEVSDVVSLTDFSLVTYINDGKYIDFYQSNSDSDTAIQVDTEDAQLARAVLINDSEGLLVSKDGTNTLVWRVGKTFLSLESDDDTETLISIAKGIKLLK